MANIYKRGETWWVQFRQGGQLVRRSLKTTRRAVAVREKQAIEGRLAESGRVVKADKNPTVETIWRKYLNEYAEPHLRPKTIEIVTNHWRQFCEFLKPKRMADVSQADMEAFKAYQKAKGRADQSVNGALKDIQGVFTWAIRAGRFSGTNPVVGVPRFKLVRKMPEFHTEDELTRLLDVAKGKSRNLEWTVLLAGWSGLRKGELVNLRWEHLDFNETAPVVKVRSSHGFHIKTSQERDVPMNQRVRDALYPYRKDKGYVFVSDRPSEGRHFYRYDPRNPLRDALKKADLTQADPFQMLRRTFGSILAQKGVPLYKIARWMGHSVAVCEKHYAGLMRYDPEIDVF